LRSSQESTESSSEEESSSSTTHKESDSEQEDKDEEPLKIQRVIASKTETKAEWKEICKNINSSEVNYGSRW
jgi:hypothetical protein